MAENYPVGIQHFSELIQKKGIYVDKTPHIYNLLTKGIVKSYFLSRPRRFGKSLLVSTLKEIFDGNKELFQGLYIYDKIDWERIKMPIIYLSMTDINFEKLGLDEALKQECNRIATTHGVTLPGQKSYLRELLEAVYEKYQHQVAVLIDEYDKPIVYGLDGDNVDMAEKHSSIMKAFYAGLKDADLFLGFLLITGVSKFARVSIFSDLNHLKDISLQDDYATICGYTQQEIEYYFPEGIQKLADKYALTKEECLAKIKDWYNGFSWDGKSFVYNPFSTLCLFSSSQFANYWFETGTPTFLVKMLNDDFNYKLENIIIHDSIFSLFDLRKLDVIGVLLQTGYLTLKNKLEDNIFEAGFPNKEVRDSFNQMLLGGYLEHHPAHSGVTIYQIRQAFLKNDLNAVKMIIQTMFHSLPVELFEKKDRNGKIKPVGENFYHAIIYLIFNLLGVKMKAEVVVQNGRVDAVVETAEHIYLFEFKKDESPEKAIEQIKTNKYFGQYLLSDKIIHLIGVRFSLAEKGIDAEKDWKEEILGEE